MDCRYFNYKLLMLSDNLIDYVIVHELYHLVEMNHQQQFWNLVKSAIPEYKQEREKLKQCGFLLKIYS